MRTQVGIVGAGPGRADARAAARARRHRVGRAREPQPRVRASTASARACSSRAPPTCCATPASASGCEREGIVHGGIHLQFDGERHHVPMQRADRRPLDRDLRPDRGRQGPDRSAARRAGCRCTSRSTTSRPRRRLRAAARRFADGASSELECDVDRRLRRLPRRLPRQRSRTACCATFEREYPFGWLGILARSHRRCDELVYAHHERGFALLRCARPSSRATTCRSRTTRTSPTWPDERIWEELQLRTRSTAGRSRGADPREGRDRDAQLRRRADAARPPLPRGRRRAHRPADRREGAEPRDRRRPRARRGARRLVRTAADAARRLLDACLRRVWRAEHFSWWMTRCCTGCQASDPSTAAPTLAAPLR